MQCTKKWTYLRNSFRKYIKTNASVNKSKSIKSHPYAKELKFLIPVLAEKVIRQTCKDQRKLTKNGETAEVIEIAASSEDDDDEDEEEEIANTNEIPNNHEVDSTVSDEGSGKRSGEEQPSTSKKVKTELEPGEINSSVSTVDMSAAEANAENEAEDYRQIETKSERRASLDIQNLENDPDMLFFRSLLPELHRMTSQQKNKFRLAVLTSIDDILNI